MLQARIHVDRGEKNSQANASLEFLGEYSRVLIEGTLDESTPVLVEASVTIGGIIGNGKSNPVSVLEVSLGSVCSSRTQSLGLDSESR